MKTDIDTTGIVFPAGMWDTTLACPICGFEFMHLVSCTVIQHREAVHVTHDTVTHARQEPTHARGSAIKVEAYCESGHHFVLVMQFHKGSVFVYHERLPDCPGDDGMGFIPPEELWRD